MKNLFHFLQYHNAVPIALGVVFLGAGATFAATNPEAIYSAQQKVIAVDNTYIVSKDLSAYTPRVDIVSVTEDTDNYYVGYRLSTIDIDNSVWKDVSKDVTMKVAKSGLGQYGDLGMYVTEQLNQNISHEAERLKETQEKERMNVSQKVVATSYGGLVGKFLDSTTETLPGYTPVVAPPPEPPAQVAAAAVSDGGVAPPPKNANLAPGSVLSGDPSDTEPPFVQLLGSASITLQTGDMYLDLGVVAADNGKADAVTLSLYLNGAKVERVYFASAQAGEWTITYEARDKANNITRVERHITVAGGTTTPIPTPAPAPEPTPTPTPEPVVTPTLPVIETPAVTSAPTDTTSTTTQADASAASSTPSSSSADATSTTP